MERTSMYTQGRSRLKNALIGSSIFLGVVLFTYFLLLPGLSPHEYEPQQEVHATQEEKKEVKEIKKVAHIKTPSAVKAVYMTQCAASTDHFRGHLTSLIDETELNSIIIDIKDYTGTVAFIRRDPSDEKLVGGGGCRVSDMTELIEDFHGRGIYVIGRITVFQDPYLAGVRPEWAVIRASDGSVWRDNKGLAFIDVGATPYWDWVVDLAKESYDIGFDEINFDYIRYPSDGNMRDIAFPHSGDRPKADVLESFFSYLHKELEGTGIVTSADIFGMTTTAEGDMNIGQIFERTLPYFDYVAPMVYPSHYPAGFNGYGDPNKYPYNVIYDALASAVVRAVATSTKLTFAGAIALPASTSTTQVLYQKSSFDPNVVRPWLQDFDYGGNYGPKEVRAQIQATYDAGLNSWMLWDPANNYTREALKAE